MRMTTNLAMVSRSEEVAIPSEIVSEQSHEESCIALEFLMGGRAYSRQVEGERRWSGNERQIEQ